MPKRLISTQFWDFRPLGGSNDFGIKLLGGIDVPTRQKYEKN